MTKPIIGITANVRPNPAHEDINWSYAPSGFVEGVQRAGGLATYYPYPIHRKPRPISP